MISEVVDAADHQALEHAMHVLDQHGDTKIIWDVSRQSEVDAARATFDKLKREGYMAYSVAAGGDKGEVLHAFDPRAEKVILAPRTIGG